MAKASSAKGAKKALTKSAFLTHIAEQTELSKKEVAAVLDAVVETVKSQLGPKGAGKLMIPGLARMTVTKVKAVKGGQKKINPLTGQEYVTKDKPAFNKVRIAPIKALKEALK